MKKLLLSFLFCLSLSAQSDLIFGKEYLSHFHRTIMSGKTPKVIFSGDSTTEGSGITNYVRSAIHLAFKSIVLQDLTDIQSINSGHSGMTIHQWVTNYMFSDMSQVPDLYILRWGLNPNLESTFEDDLRKGLECIRSRYPVDKMSIVLMTPNACNDTPNGRGMEYLNSLNPIVRKAARDFKCMFIDLTNIFPDCFSDSSMMDDPYKDGRRIHPSDVFNQMIAGVIAENVLSKGIVMFSPAKISIQKSNGIDVIIQSGSGTSVIEKSYDMINWFPLEVLVTGNSVHYKTCFTEPNVFFRVRR